MKETYEKPKMETESIDIGALIAGSVDVMPTPQMVSYLNLCPPCP